MKFSGLTKKGRAYLAKCQASSTPIQFTKMKFGDGKLIDNENPADLIDIKNIKIEKSILSKEQKGDAVVLTTVIDNVSLEEGYFPRETGIYVLDEGVEVLYFYMNDGDETSWIPPEADGPHRMEVKINLISSNTGSVVVHNDGKDLYITKEYLEANYTQKGEYDGTAQEIEDRVVAAVGKEDGKFPLNEAIQGNVYYFPANKKFYICKETQNRRISVPDVKFEELSIWENRKRLENLNTKHKADIASITSFRLGFNASNVLNTSKIKDKKIVYVTVRSDNMHISCQLPKNILRAMLVHGTSAKTAILSIEDTGFWLYGDITGITGIFLSEYVYD